MEVIEQVLLLIVLVGYRKYLVEKPSRLCMLLPKLIQVRRSLLRVLRYEQVPFVQRLLTMDNASAANWLRCVLDPRVQPLLGRRRRILS